MIIWSSSFTRKTESRIIVILLKTQCLMKNTGFVSVLEPNLSNNLRFKCVVYSCVNIMQT